jgi:hypothetical protein
MKLISLSTEQAPHISVPLRFFAAAPIFLILAALMLAMADDNPFTHLHAPALLAATHSITLGFITMTMLGALQQVLPVVIGCSLPVAGLIAWLSHLSLIAGTLLFSAGFIFGRPELLNAAWPTLGLAFAAFIGAALFSLARSPVQNASKTAIILSILALLAAVAIGMLMLYGYSSGQFLNYPGLYAAHIILALGGWVLLLIVGISYQVVPMFQLTPQYSKWMTLSLAPAIFITLLLQLSLLLLDIPLRWLEFAAYNLFWGFTISFSVATLMLQHYRRRRIPDITLIFFRIGMISLLCVALFSVTTQTVIYPERVKILAGIIFMIGFAMSLILGMLYKIVPFLIWFHLFRGGTFHSIPNMKEIIPETWLWRHLWLHLATLLAALLAPFWMITAQILMLCLLLQGVMLGYTMYSAIAVYRRTLHRLEQA